MIIYCQQCEEEIQNCACANWRVEHRAICDTYEWIASCGLRPSRTVEQYNQACSNPRAYVTADWNGELTACASLGACGVWGGIVHQKDTGDETENHLTPEIEALYPKPIPEPDLSEQEKERIWECLKQAARG